MYDGLMKPAWTPAPFTIGVIRQILSRLSEKLKNA